MSETNSNKKESVRYWQIEASKKFDENMEESVMGMINSKSIEKIFLVDTRKKSSSDFVENFVRETVKFHFSKLEKNLNSLNEYDILFSICNNFSNGFVPACREESDEHTQYPELSIITYVSSCNQNYIQVFTEMSSDDYKYKKFMDQTNIYFNFPRKNTQITFAGRHLSGNIQSDENSTISEAYSIIIHAYKKLEKVPNNVFYTNSSTSSDNYSIFEIKESKENIIIKSTTENVFNWEFFNNLLYNKSVEKKIIEEFFECGKCVHLIGSQTSPKRSIQRYKIENVFQDYIQKWITQEIRSELRSKHIINLHTLSSVFYFILFLLTDHLLPKLCEFSGLEKKNNLNITNIFFLRLRDLEEIQQILQKSSVVGMIGIAGSSELIFGDGLSGSIIAGDCIFFSGTVVQKIDIDIVRDTDTAILITIDGIK